MRLEAEKIWRSNTMFSVEQSENLSQQTDVWEIWWHSVQISNTTPSCEIRVVSALKYVNISPMWPSWRGEGWSTEAVSFIRLCVLRLCESSTVTNMCCVDLDCIKKKKEKENKQKCDQRSLFEARWALCERTPSKVSLSLPWCISPVCECRPRPHFPSLHRSVPSTSSIVFGGGGLKKMS